MTAYDAAGLPRTRLNSFVDAKREFRKMRQALFVEICALATEAGGTVEIATSASALIINGNMAARVDVVPFRQPARGQPSWKVQQKDAADFVIAARHDPITGSLMDFFLLPRNLFESGPLYLKASTLDRFESMRHLSVRSMFFGSALSV